MNYNKMPMCFVRHGILVKNDFDYTLSFRLTQVQAYAAHFFIPLYLFGWTVIIK